jgi:acetylornithine deacetylase/succinyl-diaminopimelate desuccinylase-like protein
MSHDWATVQAEAVAHLQRLIQCRTVNPPGNETPAAEYLATVLREAGIDVTPFESAPGRPFVLARIRGSGAKRPVMLVAHTDVVDVDATQWSVDPFGGVVQDGYVYGRGAIDDKGMLAVHLTTMLLLQRDRAQGALLDRDVVFLATPDEETGGSLGMEWLTTNRPDLLDAEYAINEGGRIRVAPDGSRTFLLQVAEKISHVVTMTARGPAGHAGVPLPDNAILRLGRSLASISAYASDPANGVSPTVIAGGSKFNVIPSDASVTMNIRLRPGEESIDTVVARLTKLVNDPDVTLTITSRGHEAPASPTASPMYTALADACRALDTSIAVTPYVSNGVTDSAALRTIGIQSYGVLPFPLDAGDEARMHGHDERVPVSGVQFGVQLIYDAVRRVGTA